MTRVVQMRALGRMGRWGNQCLQYAFLRVYAARHGAEVEIPAWAGRALLGASDREPTALLPRYEEPADLNGYPVPPAGAEVVGRDFVGWAQYHTSWYLPDRDLFRAVLQPAAELEARLRPAVAALRARGGTTVGVHLRRGDYGRTIFYVTPVEWYLRLLARLWPTLEDPVLFVATEDPELVDAFEVYAPATASSLGVELRAQQIPGYEYLPLDLRRREPHQLDFYPDFHLLSRCDVLVAPSSTFSFVPALLNPSLRQLWRSSLRLGGFAREDPWDAHPLQRDRVEHHARVPAVRLADNPYWHG